jgi:CheY-like chemotaxis protein
LTVLVVDDDADFRDFVRIVLEDHGYQVLEASDAPRGLALLRERRPDLVLLDAMMSYELTGLGLIRSIRGDPQLANIPLILISAVLSQDEDRFLGNGERQMVNRFLTKPVSPDALQAEVDSLLANRESSHAPSQDSDRRRRS